MEMTGGTVLIIDQTVLVDTSSNFFMSLPSIPRLSKPCTYGVAESHIFFCVAYKEKTFISKLAN